MAYLVSITSRAERDLMARAFCSVSRRLYRDALIAATALVHGIRVVTRNVDYLKPTGVAVVNPWQS